MPPCVRRLQRTVIICEASTSLPDLEDTTMINANRPGRTPGPQRTPRPRGDAQPRRPKRHGPAHGPRQRREQQRRLGFGTPALLDPGIAARKAVLVHSRTRLVTRDRPASAGPHATSKSPTETQIPIPIVLAKTPVFRRGHTSPGATSSIDARSSVFVCTREEVLGASSKCSRRDFGWEQCVLLLVTAVGVMNLT